MVLLEILTKKDVDKTVYNKHMTPIMYSGFLLEPILPDIGIKSEVISKNEYNVNIVGIIVKSKYTNNHFLTEKIINI